MESMIYFDLVSPEQLVFNDKTGMIIVPGKEGDIGVLPGHSKLLSSLRPGRIMVYGEDKHLLQSFFVSGGFVEINPEKCIVLAEEVFEMSALNKNEIEKQVQELENEIRIIAITNMTNNHVVEIVFACIMFGFAFVYISPDMQPAEIK